MLKSDYRCERRRHPRNDCLQQDCLDILRGVRRTLHRLKSPNDRGRLHIKEVPTRSLACRHLPHTVWKVMVITGLSIGHFAENSRRKKLKLKTTKAKTQDFFSKNLVFRQFFTMCMHNF